MKWLAFIGISIQFLSFWFAAPELLGKAALERFEERLKRLITAIPLIVLFLFILGYSFSFAGYGVYTGLQGAEKGMSDGDMYQYMIVFAVASVVYGIFLFFFKRIKLWITKRISHPLVETLINKSETRQQSLVIGAVLFTLGFIIQAVLLFLE